MEKKDILLFFYRPWEPIFYPKRNNGERCIFEVPADFLTGEFRRKASSVLNMFNDDPCRRIDLGPFINEDLYELDLSQVTVCTRKEPFSAHSKRHMAAAAHLIDVFQGCNKHEDLIVHAAYCRDRVNVELFIYALSTIIAYNGQELGLYVPLPWQVFPRNFVEPQAINAAVNSALVFDDPSQRVPIEIQSGSTGRSDDPEQRLAYWREDIGLNNYHWHWHLIYPTSGQLSIVNKDRRGESFYYIHHQIMARYNAERLCNRLNPAKRFVNWRQPIDTGYFPNLDTPVAGQKWASRSAGVTLQNLSIGSNLDIADLERFRDRAFAVIQSKTARASNGQTVSINSETGINILANLIESNAMSIDQTFYGSLHDSGHILIAYVNDPQGRSNAPPGVMVSSATSMRDPMFYEWHGFLNDMFIQHKNSLDPYSVAQLTFPNIVVSNFSVYKLNSNGQCDGTGANELETFWQKRDLDLSRGLDFAPNGPIFVRFTHLNHTEFMYNIDINNSSSSAKMGTVRIFMAPANNANGAPLNIEQQRHLMMEMDKFVVTLQPGSNKIARKSSESTLTIPFEQTFRDLNQDRPSVSNPQALDRFNFCGCGWPQHLLLTKGSEAGFPMQLFVMVSNNENDRILQASPSGGCKTGVSFCGLKDLKYPDKQSMGYPFDRRPRSGVSNLNNFLTPNMKAVQVTIVHSNVVRQSQASNDITRD